MAEILRPDTRQYKNDPRYLLGLSEGPYPVLGNQTLAAPRCSPTGEIVFKKNLDLKSNRGDDMRLLLLDRRQVQSIEAPSKGLIRQ